MNAFTNRGFSSSDRYIDLYNAKFGAYARSTTVGGPLTLIDARQMAGDLSRPGSDEVVLARILSRSFHTIDFGAGRKSQWWAANDFAVCPPNFANTVISDHPHHIQIVAMQYPALAALEPDLGLAAQPDFGSLHELTKPDAELVSFLDLLFRIDLKDIDAMMSEFIALTLVARLHSLNGKPRRPSRPREHLSGWQRQKAVERLAALDLPAPTLAELAKLCAMSPSHFCRAFRAETGLPPHRYQTVQRIQKARELLSASELAIAEVAHRAGYEDPAYFSRLFSRETGFSPSEWRREFKR